ncbi:hypothetical protein ACIQZD_25725 [Peribacillus sp. NPDC096447]|uniref:hypothetical protein n=1 Tax=Peribacillus sp. NPDC096447 TaxID=3364394 RepID=UPI003826AB6A
MNDWYGLLITLMLLAIQYFLSTRNNPYWGVVLPILYLSFLVYFRTTGILEVGIIKLSLLFVVGEAFLLGYWIHGRQFLSNKRKKELEKMKTQDIR